MKIPFPQIAVLLICISPQFATSAPMTEARINRVQRDVQVTEANGSARRAGEGESVRGSQGVRTGSQSAAELLFPDQTLARLGSDTLFTFEGGTRKMNLENGTLLFQIPKGVGGASIRTGAITAAITGTTGFIERGKTHYKLVLLEGTMRVYLNDRTRESMLITSGQMLIGPIQSKSIKNWQAVQIDTEKLIKTSKLLDPKKFAPLSKEASGKIEMVIADQKVKLQQGGLVSTNLAIDGYGTTLIAVSNSTEVITDTEDSVDVSTPTPVPTTTPIPTPTPIPTATPIPTPTPVPTPTTGPTPTPVPTPTTGPTPTPVPTPTTGPTPTPVPTPTTGPTPTPVPTPTTGPTPTPVPTPTTGPTPTPVPTPTTGPTPTPVPTPTTGPTPTPVPTSSPDDETADYPGFDESALGSGPYLLPTLHPTAVKITNPSDYEISGDAGTLFDLQGQVPKIISDGNSRNGTTYGGVLVDGPAASFLFGSENDFDAQTRFSLRFGSNYDHSFPTSGVSIFSFVELQISGTPQVVAIGPFRDVALISDNRIEVDGSVALDGFTSLTLASKLDEIVLKSGGNVATSANSFTFLHLYSRAAEVKVENTLSLPAGDLYIDAADGISLKSGSDVVFRRGLFNSSTFVRLEGLLESNYLQIDAGEDIEFRSAIQSHELFASSDQSISVEQAITAAPKPTDIKGGSVSLAGRDVTVTAAITAKGAPGLAVPNAGSTIKIVGRRLTGAAVSIESTGQLKALLNQAVTGPGGKVAIESRGGDILIKGTVLAENGIIDIQNTGSNGLISFDGATLSADVVKANALGTNGTLTIKGGSISANTLLKLYAGGSNGTVRFEDNVTLNGNSAKIISANTVRIESGKVVTVNGPAAAEVFTNNPQYSGSGGNGSTSGTFENKGAITKPASQKPSY